MMVQKPTEAPLFPFWIEDRGLSFFFGFLVLITIFVPMVHLSRSGRIALDLIFALMLFSGAVATIRKKILMYLVIALTGDRKSTRLNSSHGYISYAVFCLKKKKKHLCIVHIYCHCINY